MVHGQVRILSRVRPLIKLSSVKLSNEKLHKALEICADNHSTKLSMNHLMGKSFVPNAHPLVIHECCPAVINKLKEEDFMLGMSEYGMTVDHLDL